LIARFLVDTFWLGLACGLIYHGTGSVAAVIGVLIIAGLAVQVND
jgi:hypothetical protein